MTPEQIEMFLQHGRNLTGQLAQVIAGYDEWAKSFEARGGAAVYGDDALELVYLSNDLQAWVTPEHAATIAKYRSDI